MNWWNVPEGCNWWTVPEGWDRQAWFAACNEVADCDGERDDADLLIPIDYFDLQRIIRSIPAPSQEREAL